MFNFISIFLFSFFISFVSYSNQIEILSDIPGQGLKIQEHYKIKVNYRGFLENGDEFDSSYKELKFNDLIKSTRNALNEVVHSFILIPRILLAT